MVFVHSSPKGCAPTTNFSVSLKNGAPGSSSTVRSRHAGANISNVRRPSRMVDDCPVIAPMVSPIFGSKPYSNVQLGASKTPSRVMNSCTAMVATVKSSRVVIPTYPTNQQCPTGQRPQQSFKLGSSDRYLRRRCDQSRFGARCQREGSERTPPCG